MMCSTLLALFGDCSRLSHVLRNAQLFPAFISSQELLVRLSACLGQLFQHPEIVKLGFKGAADFEKLACSYPEMACFRRINSVIDTCTLAQQSLPALIRTKKLPASVLQGKPLKQLGLSRLCQVVLDGKGLDKAQQCSAWHLRPLTPEQVSTFAYK
jgi:hypothetical protein